MQGFAGHSPVEYGSQTFRWKLFAIAAISGNFTVGPQ